jgi:pyrroline-5-carboxylate reductase
MQIGLIGAGNMARALARGWDRPVLCTDVLPQRAEALARETGGQALPGAADVARGADLVVLCHKPAQLAEVAAQTGGEARAVVSILGGVPRADVAAAYPDRPVYRVLPSTPVEVRQGVVLLARAEPQPLDDAITELFGGLGLLVPLDEELIDTGMGLMSTAPAYYALVAEAQVDAGVRHGLPADRAAQLVVQTMAGTAALLKHRDYDTLAARREVTSPGGSTARGLDALERAGIRAAFSDALDAVRRQGVRSR